MAATSSERSGVSSAMAFAAIWSMVVPPRMSAPVVFFGRTALSQAELAREWFPAPSPSAASAVRMARLETTTIRSRWFSRGASIDGSSNPDPDATGVHCSRITPLGT